MKNLTAKIYFKIGGFVYWVVSVLHVCMQVRNHYCLGFEGFREFGSIDVLAILLLFLGG